MDHSAEPNNYEELAAKWIDKTISPEQAQAFNSWYNQGQDQPLSIPLDFVEDAERHKERIYQKVLAGLDLDMESEPARKTRWQIPLIAAVLLILSVVIYWYVWPSARYDLAELADSNGKGSKIAVLYEADGTQVLLKDSIFIASRKVKNAKPGSTNTIATPNGSMFKVILEDGTKVWLEAGSSLTYPVVFDAHKRVVQLSGEAHFDVMPDAEKPFHVAVRNKKDRMDVEVKGTKFDVMGYKDDEEIRTHVFEGSVKVSGGGLSVMLSKGEQISLSKGVLSPKVFRPEKEWGMWKNQIEFDNEKLRQVVRKIARRYNMKMVNSGTPSDEALMTGILSYKSGVKEMLSIIELVVNCRIEVKGDTIVLFETLKPGY